MLKWEYKVIVLHTTALASQWEDDLNYWGHDGYELVSMAATTEAGRFKCVLKRVVRDEND